MTEEQKLAEENITDPDDKSVDVPEEEIPPSEASTDEVSPDLKTEEEEEDAPRPEGTEWYVVHSYSGYENKVQKNLHNRIESMSMQDKIFQVVVPTEEEVELRDGQRRTIERRVFPGYILVEILEFFLL